MASYVKLLSKTHYALDIVPESKLPTGKVYKAKTDKDCFENGARMAYIIGDGYYVHPSDVALVVV